MYRKQSFVLIIIALLFPFSSFAQPELPDMAGVSQNAVNILTWRNQYDGIKSIAVQRSSDSSRNYTTIGYVRDLKKGLQAYIDGHPMSGKNWYRLNVVFASDLNWITNTFALELDSMAIAKARVLPPNDSLQKFVNLKTGTVVIPASGTSSSQPGGKTGGIAVEVPNLGELTEYSYVRSQYVFTNPFSGHINVQLPDAELDKYSVDFYDTKNVKIFDIPKMPKAQFVIDKRNFQSKGIFRFDLKKDGSIKETGYITIY